MNKILNIAHRGASSLVTENTIASFKKAIEIGCDGIEFDVHLTLDGELIIFHDQDLSRMTGGKINSLIGNLTLDEVREISLIKGEKIPTFDEFMDFLIKTNEKPELQIEIKKQLDDRNIVKVLIEKLEKYDYLDNIYISSFDSKYLKKVRDFSKDIKTIYLSRECVDYSSVESILIDISANGVHFLIQEVQLECVDHFKGLNYLVGAWKLKADVEMMKKANNFKLFRATADNPSLFSKVIGNTNS